MVRTSMLRVSALLLALPLAAGVAAQERVGDFSLLDQAGYHHGMSWYGDHELVAFLVQANGSAAVEAALPEYLELRGEYDARGVEFMMINPMGGLDREAVAEQVAHWGVEIPVLMDDSQVVSEALGIERAGEVLLYNPKSFVVEYRGAVAGARAALDEFLAGEEVSVPLVATVGGDKINYPLQGVPSYSEDIAPVLAENCATCHRAGGVAPFAMDSHTMVRGWSPMIREVLMTRRMPPGQIDGHIGNFINDRLIDREDLRNIIAWVEAGAPVDGDSDPLAGLTWPESKWAFGEPDLVLDIPATTVPATGNGVFVNVEVPIDLPQDRWLRGSQIIAGDRTVLHHTVNQLDYPEEIGRRTRFLAGDHPDKADITAYIPGDTPDLSPPNTGGLLKAGSLLHLNMHYTPNGRETVDRSQLGLWFYPEDEVPEERMSGRCACVFTPTWTTIPPHDPNFEQTASIVIERDARIHSFLPHMHFRGKYMRFYADYPDGTQEELINIAKYNYNWQLSYTYEEPKFVPGGTKSPRWRLGTIRPGIRPTPIPTGRWTGAMKAGTKCSSAPSTGNSRIKRRGLIGPRLSCHPCARMRRRCQ